MAKGKLAYVLGAMGLAAITVGAAVDAPVADTAMGREVEAVRSLLDGGADVNAAQGDGMTGLHWAAKHGNVEMAAMLIGAGANPEAVTRLGEHTPLHVASTAGHASVVNVLVEAGADANASTTTGATPLHFASASGSGEAVEVLLARGAEPDAREPQWGQTPLMFAAAADRVDAITALLDGGAAPGITAKVVDISARSEMDQAEKRQRKERMVALQERRARGERVDLTEPVPAPKFTRSDLPEQQAAAVKADLLVETPCSGCQVGYPDLVGTYGGLTALLLAAREGHIDAVLALLDGGADPNQVSAADNTSAMLIASINGHFDLAMLLLERGADPRLASDAGATPLYAALNIRWAPESRHPQPTDYLQQEVSYLQLMEAVLEAGVDPNVRLTKSLWFTTYNRDMLGVNRAGATSFWRAAHALDIEAMRLLLAYGAEPNLPTLAARGSAAVPAKTQQSRNPGGDTDHSGLPPVAMGGPGVYPIHAASGVGYGQGYAGNTHRHVLDAWLPAVKFLVEELDADVNARDHNGYNPVHHAAARGDNELILYLVEQGADVTAVSRRGQTTMDMANGPVQRMEPFPETLALLESLGATNNHNCVSC
jgi:ankyrin repeat protein